MHCQGTGSELQFIQLVVKSTDTDAEIFSSLIGIVGKVCIFYEANENVC